MSEHETYQPSRPAQGPPEIHREEFPSEVGFLGYQRLVWAHVELNHGGWKGARELSKKQQEEGVFWVLLGMDPIVQAYDHLPADVLADFPPIAKVGTPLDSYIAKMMRVSYLFATKPEVVIGALKKVW
jgi:hypothetical protein